MAENMLVIDTDPGVDDALAILSALSRHTQHLANVLAITTVRGNVGIDQTCLNTLRVLQVADRLDIPVYRGADRALCGSAWETATYFHGKDGFGDVPDADAPDIGHIQSEHAVLALLRLANQFPGKITLVCIGPLTNVAVALRLDQTFDKKLRQCIIMGGNTLGKGNVTQSAEFNFYADPEAANVVLNEMSCRITMIPWELCLQYSLPWVVFLKPVLPAIFYSAVKNIVRIVQERFDKIFEHQSRRSQFTRNILSVAIENYYGGKKSEKKDRQKFVICDEIAVALALDENVAVASVEASCSVETTGKWTRGQMVVHRELASTVVRLVTEVDLQLCEQYIAAALVD